MTYLYHVRVGMDEVDIAAVASAKSEAAGGVVRGTCGVCERPMYRDPLYPGVVVEWRHVSTSQPLSWNPEKHIASETVVKPHGHRLVPASEQTKACAIGGCGATMLERVFHAPESLEGRAAKAQASRMRGTFNSRKTAKAT